MGATAKPHTARKTVLKDFVSWFEIPVYDLARAKAFYDHVYGMSMETSFSGDYAMAFFPADGGIGGALVQGPGCMPNDCGTLVYLNAGRDLDGMLARVEEAGGRIIMGRSLISDSAGWFALFVDSEGNRMALHAAPAASPAPKPAAKRSPRKRAAAGKRKAPAKAKKPA
jgi:predicted enzyme related to lactoylglutathione lyase